MKLRALLKTGHFYPLNVFLTSAFAGILPEVVCFSDLYDGEEGIQYQIVSASTQHSPLESGGYFICPSPIRSDQIIYCESPSRFSISLFTQFLPVDNSSATNGECIFYG